jgi:transposase
MSIQGSELMAPCWLKGYTDANSFNAWLSDHLLPTLQEGMTIIMDNARFSTKELIEAARCTLLFLPPYSPDLNPIEHRWFPLKNTARKIFQTFLCLTSAIEPAILTS